MIHQHWTTCYHNCHICSHLYCPFRRDDCKPIISKNEVFGIDYTRAYLNQLRNDCAYNKKGEMTNSPSMSLVFTHGFMYWVKSWYYFKKRKFKLKKQCRECNEFQKCNIREYI